MTRRFLPAIVVCLLSCTAVRAWTDDTRTRMAGDVTRIAPPKLARILKRHAPAWQAGWNERSPAAGREAGDGEAGKRVEAVLAAIRDRADAETFARLLGAACRLAADANDPLAGDGPAASALRAEGSASAFDRYAQGVIRRTPAVFSGWTDDAALLADVSGFLEARARIASADAEALQRAFHPGGRPKPVRTSTFDDRSIPFAVATLGHSRAVSDSANLAFAIWKKIGGDTAGTPWLGRDPGPAPPAETERRP